MRPGQKQALQQQLTALSNMIDKSISAIEDRASQLNFDPYKMMTADGHHMLSPLLLAKAEVLSSLVSLETKGK